MIFPRIALIRTESLKEVGKNIHLSSTIKKNAGIAKLLSNKEIVRQKVCQGMRGSLLNDKDSTHQEDLIF